MIATGVLLRNAGAGMAAVTALLITWLAETRTSIRASVVVLLLLMMVAMVGGRLNASPGAPRPFGPTGARD